MSVTARKFGVLPTGEEVTIYKLQNASGAYTEVIDYGAIWVSTCVPDKDGKLTDVTLGYDNIEGYMDNGAFFGAIIGRNGNRIAGAKFSIYGKETVLAQNENENNLHSGPNGFEKKMWKVDEVNQERNSVIFNRISPDGENGFHGEFDISVQYEFTEENEVRITYQGVCTEPTVANMTNHVYFNLAGEGSGDILNQYLTIHAKYYTPVVDSKAIPTGEYAEVAGTPMDFNTATKIGERIDSDFQQLIFGGGYDHNYVTDNYAEGNIRPIAEAYCEETGIEMQVTTDCPCVQLYAGNFIGEKVGKQGHVYLKRHGFCLETQVEPNAINEVDFHSPILEEGETYNSVTTYRFSVK